jgi:very-short-patch-repair endonuclease
MDMGTDPAPAPSTRSLAVQAAKDLWVKSLVDIGGTNTLLFFKDRKTTLDLSAAAPTAMARLFSGSDVAVDELFPGEQEQKDATARTRALRDRVRILAEERGVHVGYLACGMATWTDASRRTPAAPVLLRSAHVSAAGGDRRFKISLDEGFGVNTALLHLLQQDFGTALAEDDFADLRLDDSAARPDEVLPAVLDLLLSRTGGRVPDFVVKDRFVLGLFNYRTLPMVRDLQLSGELLASCDIVAAIAGDSAARTAINFAPADPGPTAPDRVAPQDEFLVLDADSSQSHAVDSAVGGRSIVIEGPPGTGKSQTIANLIAAAIARGEKVLFVAEKRAAIDAVLTRLSAVGLRGLVMDLYDGVPSKQHAAKVLSEAMTGLPTGSGGGAKAYGSDLSALRGKLVRHRAMMHDERSPWGVTVYQAQAATAATAPEARVTTRFGGAVLNNLAGEALDRALARLDDYVGPGGLRLSAENTPWFGARVTAEAESADAGFAAQAAAATAFPDAARLISQAAAEAGLPIPAGVSEWAPLLDLLRQVRALMAIVKPDAFAIDLAGRKAATGTRSWRKQHTVKQSWSQRRAIIKECRGLFVEPQIKPAQMHARLVETDRLRQQWEEIRVDSGLPQIPESLSGADKAFAAWTASLKDLARYVAVGFAELSTESVQSRLTWLADDTKTLHKLPHIYRAHSELSVQGLESFLAELRTRKVPDGLARAALLFAWHSSIIDRVRISEHDYAVFDGPTLTRQVADFAATDRTHIASGAARVRAQVHNAFLAACRDNDTQLALVKKETNKKTRHLPPRELLRQAPAVVLGATPCWAMSPLMVSQVLPPERLFDLVVFDEASQIPPAEAISSIIRAHRVVVAGDRRQLPPTSFFSKIIDEEDAEETEPAAPDAEPRQPDLNITRNFESILDTLDVLLQRRPLTWHYRSADERLIAFSNRHIYGGSLTTFPGTAEQSPIRFVPVATRGDGALDSRSNSVEVERVVSLVLEHAEARPGETLGVITMGSTHASRIDAALRQARESRPELDPFFDDRRKDRFFVKSIELVQGDERDAIILSVGYAKRPDGQMRYNFGPLNNEGGERRLNVAVTRARHRITLAASFTHADMDPSRLAGRGPQLLRDYLQFAESGGANLGDGAPGEVPLNPFELDIAQRLEAAGIPVLAQHGAAGYRIDFAARHPERPGRFVLAIEADGATYHSSATARDRDRLRQEHLERLGWRFHRIWSTDWFTDPVHEVGKVREAYDRAVRLADQALLNPPAATFAAAAPSPEAPAALAASPIPVPEPAPSLRTGKRPVIVPGRPIKEYSNTTLRNLVQWIESDATARTEDEVMREAMRELGLGRLGTQIRAALEQAVAAARRRT